MTVSSCARRGPERDRRPRRLELGLEDSEAGVDLVAAGRDQLLERRLAGDEEPLRALADRAPLLRGPPRVAVEERPRRVPPLQGLGDLLGDLASSAPELGGRAEEPRRLRGDEGTPGVEDREHDLERGDAPLLAPDEPRAAADRREELD